MERVFEAKQRSLQSQVDLKREIDLVEEIVRLYGVDKVPATPPRGATGANEFDAVHDQLAEARRILTGLGLHEAQGQTLISRQSAEKSGAQTVSLENPLSSDMDVLRPSLLPGLLDSLRHNLARKTDDVALFEELWRQHHCSSDVSTSGPTDALPGILPQCSSVAAGLPVMRA